MGVMWLYRVQGPWKAASFSSRMCIRNKHSSPHLNSHSTISLLNQEYATDHMTNISPSIKEKLGMSLHNRAQHPINLIRQRIQDFFYRSFVGRTGNPIFAVFDNLSPVVSFKQNFDSLLVPNDHPSRHPKVSLYYNNCSVLTLGFTYMAYSH